MKKIKESFGRLVIGKVNRSLLWSLVVVVRFFLPTGRLERNLWTGWGGIDSVMCLRTEVLRHTGVMLRYSVIFLWMMFIAKTEVLYAEPALREAETLSPIKTNKSVMPKQTLNA